MYFCTSKIQGASKMTQCIKVLNAKPEDLNSLLGTHMVFRENQLNKFSEIHMHTMARAHPCTYAQINIKQNKTVWQYGTFSMLVVITLTSVNERQWFSREFSTSQTHIISFKLGSWSNFSQGRILRQKNIRKQWLKRQLFSKETDIAQKSLVYPPLLSFSWSFLSQGLNRR